MLRKTVHFRTTQNGNYASMRPQRNAAENHVTSEQVGAGAIGFNEAAA